MTDTQPPSDRRPLLVAAAILIVGSAAAVDPWGWAPYGPARWALISTVAVVIAALTLRLGSIELHRSSALGWLTFLIWAAIAGITALDPFYTWIGTPDRHLGLITIVILALMFVAGQQLADPGSVTTLLRGSVVALGIIGLYTLLEVLDLAPVDLATASGRPGGPYGTAAYLGAACALLIPMAFGAAFDRESSSRWRYFASAAAGFGVFAALASQTRAGWAGLLVATAVVLGTNRGWLRRRWPAVAAAGALLAIIAVISPVGPRLASALDFNDGTARGRLDEWQVGAAVAVKHPAIGVGLEGYRVAFAEGVDADYERRYTRATMPDRAHNGALDVAVATGIPGMALYLTAAAFLIARGWRALHTGSVRLTGIAAGVIGYLAQQFFLFPIAEVDPLLWLFAGVLVAAAPGGAAARVKVPGRAWIVLLVVAAAVLVAGLLDIAADRRTSDALEHFASGDTAGALDLADSAVDLRPDSIRYHVAAAAAAAAAGTPAGYEAAIERLDAALDLSPEDPILRAERAAFTLRLAQVAQDVSILEAAFDLWEELVMHDPVHAGYRVELGNAYAIAGQGDAAEAQWLTAADLAPRSTVPLTKLAKLYLDTDRPALAADFLEQARAVDPAAPEIARLADRLPQ